MSVVALLAGTAWAQVKSTQNAGTQQATTAVSRREANRAKIRKMSPKEIADMQTARLNKVVGLTEGQQKKVNAVYLEEAKEMKGRMADRKKAQEKINSILTREQVQKLQSVKDAKVARMRARAANRSGK